MKLSNLDANQVLRAAFNDTTEGLEIISSSASTPIEYDEIALSYTSGDLTGVIYKKNGNTISTLTLSYTSGDLTGIVWS